jgi:hypothetical protein
MKQSKLNEYFERPLAKLVATIVLTLILILISLILFEDLDLDPSMLIYNIYGTIALVSFLYSFYTTNKKLYNDLSLGVNRKSFYIRYLKNIFFVLGISLFFIAYYILLYKFIIGDNKPIFAEFKLEILIYLSTIFLSLSFLGFLLGILKMKRGIFYTLAIIITTLIVLSLIYLTILYLLSILLGVVIIGLGILNYYVLKLVNL